jgi:adenylate kinase family enzyme
VCSNIDATRPLGQVLGDVKAAFNPEVVFVLGGPGSGKGTQCEQLVANFSFNHLSAGDLLRAEIARGSPQGSSIKRTIELGQLVPVEVTLALLRSSMRTSRGTKFLVDGFPRALDQAAAFEAVVCSPSRVLFIDTSDDVMTARLLHRGKTSGRGDDNPATIKLRLKTFHEQSMPVLDLYNAEGKVCVCVLGVIACVVGAVSVGELCACSVAGVVWFVCTLSCACFVIAARCAHHPPHPPRAGLLLCAPHLTPCPCVGFPPPPVSIVMNPAGGECQWRAARGGSHRHRYS